MGSCLHGTMFCLSAWGAQALAAHRLEKAGQSPDQRVHSPCFTLGHQIPLHAGPETKTGSGMNAVVSGFLSGYMGTVGVLPGGEDWNGGPWSLFILRVFHASQEGESGAQEEENQVRLGTSAE